MDYHVYECPGGWRRIAFLNIDWTTTGNNNRVTLQTSALQMPIDVVEGRITQVLEKDGLAVAFPTPGMICAPLKTSDRDVSIKAGGVGNVTIQLLSSRGIARIDLDGQPVPASANGKLILDFGPRWKEVSLCVQVRWAD